MDTIIEKEKQSRKNEIIEVIEELCSKGYSYRNICVFLSDNDILSGEEGPVARNTIKYYVKKYDIKIKPYINVEAVYFKKDRYQFLINQTFYPINAKKQLFVIESMSKSVEKTRQILTANEYEANMRDYSSMISKLKNKVQFKVYNKRFTGDYPGRNLLAVKIRSKDGIKILLKSELFVWMRQNDQYLIYSENEEIHLRGIIQTENILFSYRDDLPFEQLLNYIYVPENNKGEYEKIQICSEDSFKIAVNTARGLHTRVIRIHGEIEIPVFELTEDELYQKIKKDKGIKPLKYSDIYNVAAIYQTLENEKRMYNKYRF